MTLRALSGAIITVLGGACIVDAFSKPFDLAVLTCCVGVVFVTASLMVVLDDQEDGQC